MTTVKLNILALASVAIGMISCSGCLRANAQDNENLRQFYEQQTQNYEQDLIEARQEGQKWQESDILRNAGTAYQYLGQFEQAVELYQQALEIAQQISDFARAESALRQLVSAYSNLGDYQGITFLEGQLAAARNQGDAQLEKIILSSLGTAYMSATNYQAAEGVYEQYLRLLSQNGDKAAEAEALSNLAIVYTAQGKYEQAIPIIKAGITLTEELSAPSLLNSLKNQLGTAYRFLGDNQQALAVFQSTLETAQAQQDVFQQWQTLQTMAKIYTALEDYNQALALHQQRLNLLSQGNNPNFAFWEPLTLEDLSATYFWLNDYGKAIALQESALEKYRSFYQKAQQQPNAVEATALERLGFLHWQAGNITPAEQSLRQALQVYETQRQQVLSNSNLLALSRDEINLFSYESANDVYRILQQILVAQNRTDEALEASEQGRARAYVDMLVSRLATNPRASISAAPPNLAQIKEIAKTENTTLVQYTVLYEYGRLYRYRFGKEQPLINATGLLVWVIQPTGEITFRQVKFNKELETLVHNARTFITSQGRSFRVPQGEKSPLQELHAMLIEPIADLLPKSPNERVTFIPQDTLFLVPFPALQDEDGKYLIEKHTVLTSPSIQVISLARQVKEKMTPQSTNLVVGNPTMPEIEAIPGGERQQLSSLPGAEAEAQAIAQLLETQPLIGNRATEKAVVTQMQQARLIHMATHGLLDDTGGVLSSLALAPEVGNDGFLTATEIFNLNLNAELAVLSACDTGRGRITGDGVVGLSRSFISAGAPSVVVSLWAIPDQPTAKLMQEFYQNLQGDMDKATAMRQAMLATKKEFPSPRAWAAFTLIGVVD